MFLKVGGQGMGAIAPGPVPVALKTPRGMVVRVPIVMRRRGMGAVSAPSYLVRPGPDGGTEIVDPSGNVIYTADEVAANPALLTTLPNPCGGGLLPTFFPGGESTCAGTEIVPGVGNTPSPQFNYPINGSCAVAGWCLTGTNALDPNSYEWQGGGTPTSPNPAAIYSAPQLGSGFTTPVVLTTSGPTAAQTAAASSAQPFATPSSNSTPASTMAPTSTAPVAATASLQNTSRPGQSFQVGDSWKLIATGAPNASVSVTASQNGQSLGTTNYGSTDFNGNFSLTGTMDASTAGNWAELVTVGVSPAPTLNFSVAPTPTSPSSTAASGSSATSSSIDFSGITNFLTSDVSLLGFSVPMWGLIGGGAVALWLITSMGRKGR